MAHSDSFQVIGIEARTTNAQEAGSDGVIPKLWARLFRESLLEQIKNRTGSGVIALYTGYENDKDGAYNYVLGAKVSSVEDIPAGMTAHKVPAGKYAVFSAKGESSPTVIVNLWQRIWSLESSGDLYRAYKTDFEIHNERQAGVDIYVGVKE